MFLLDAFSICKRLHRSAINKCNTELQHLSKELCLSKNFLLTQLSSIDFYIFIKSITSHNKKSLQKSLYTQQKKLSSLTRDCNLPIFTSNKTITNLTEYELSQEEYDLLKQLSTFQSNQIKFENLKSSLPLKRFFIRFLTTSNPRKPKFR